MLADFACNKDFFFDGVCTTIRAHDPIGLFGPLAERLVGPLALLVVLYAGGRLLRRIGDSAMHRAGIDAQVRVLVHNVVTVATIVVAVLSALVAAGVNVAVLVTAAGLGTVVIGLALQDVLRNLLAGIYLLVEHPFRLGDYIVIGDQAGTVQTITLRTTTLRTTDGQMAIVPNLTAFSEPIINSSRFDLRRFSLSVRLPTGGDTKRALQEVRAALAQAPEVAKQPAAFVQPVLDGEAVVIRCRFWVDQRQHDPDQVTADLASRLAPLARATASGA